MRNPWVKVCVAVALLLIGGLTAVLWDDTNEPVYKGKRLSFWVERMAIEDPDGRPDETSIEAVLVLGTKGLPYYLRWIQYSPSPAQIRVRAVANSILFKLGRHQFLTDHTARRTEGALETFKLLRGRAKEVSVELEKLSRDKDPIIRRNAEIALESINGISDIPLVFEEIKFQLRDTNVPISNARLR
jgi:hypothetical protein